MKYILTMLMLFSFLQAHSSSSLHGIEVIYGPPKPEEFVALRVLGHMRERKISSAEKGIPNSLFWVTLRKEGQLIGMGRVVGDGGVIAQITDVVVHPDYQGNGYGAFILTQIQEFILREIPDDAFVCLFAVKGKEGFYEAKGFQLAEDKWPGMFWPCVERVKIQENRKNQEFIR